MNGLPCVRYNDASPPHVGGARGIVLRVNGLGSSGGIPMSATKRLLAASACALLAACAASAAAPVVKDGQDTKKPANVHMDKLWADLASQDDGDASRALLALAATPKETVALLAARLAPVKADAARVGKLLEQLDDGDFDKRAAAKRELEYLDRFAKPLLTKALDGDVSPEVKKSIGDLLKRLPPEGKQEAPKFRGGNVSVMNRNGQIEITIDGKKLDLEAMAKPVTYPVNAPWL